MRSGVAPRSGALSNKLAKSQAKSLRSDLGAKSESFWSSEAIRERKREFTKTTDFAAQAGLKALWHPVCSYCNSNSN